MVYSLFLALHSLWRWVVLIAIAVRLGRVAVARKRVAVASKSPRGAYTELDRQLGLAAVISLDIQLLFGLVLYATAPSTAVAMSDVGAAMKDPYLRFWLVEHGPVLVIATVIAHVGNVLVRRAESAARKHTLTHQGLTNKIDLRSFKLHFVPNTYDAFVRKAGKTNAKKNAAAKAKHLQIKKKRVSCRAAGRSFASSPCSAMVMRKNAKNEANVGKVGE